LGAIPSGPERRHWRKQHRASCHPTVCSNLHFDQWLIEANDFAALTRYARGGGRRPPDARELRPKNAYNLLRLIALATGWLRDGMPAFEATGALRERLLDIKHGRVALEDVLRDAETLAPELEAARDSSPLPEHPDYARADRLLRRAGEELARRWVLQEPGPWGREAPASPEYTSGAPESEPE